MSQSSIITTSCNICGYKYVLNRHDFKLGHEVKVICNQCETHISLIIDPNAGLIARELYIEPKCVDCQHHTKVSLMRYLSPCNPLMYNDHVDLITECEYCNRRLMITFSKFGIIGIRIPFIKINCPLCYHCDKFYFQGQSEELDDGDLIYDCPQCHSELIFVIIDNKHQKTQIKRISIYVNCPLCKSKILFHLKCLPDNQIRNAEWLGKCSHCHNHLILKINDSGIISIKSNNAVNADIHIHGSQDIKLIEVSLLNLINKFGVKDRIDININIKQSK